MTSSPLPKPPFRYLGDAATTSAADGSASVASRREFWTGLSSLLGAEIAADENALQRSYVRSREIQALLVRAGMALESSLTSPPGAEEEEHNDLTELVRETVRSPDMYRTSAAGGGVRNDSEDVWISIHPRAQRLGNLSWRMEEFATHAAFNHFLSTGTLLSPASLALALGRGEGKAEGKVLTQRFLTDEEYLGGACIGLCQRLARYGVGRATDLDASSVRIARDVAAGILEELLRFDFRNGPLRKKYDGTKYALKTLETLLYELSVTGAAENGDSDGEGAKKRTRFETDEGVGATAEGDSKVQETSPKVERIPTDELAALRERMEHRDELRETLIKKCRDGQKAAKQAIFALHRGDSTRASILIKKSEDCIQNDLLPIVREEPGLQYGSFAGVVEEYVEARLFQAWLHGKDGISKKIGDSSSPSGLMLGIDDFPFALEPEAYLGGLCDLTGEVGRFAVARGTVRDKESVRLCLETNKSILTSLQVMGKLPGGTSKKMSALYNSVEKLERIIYELSLVQSTGRKYASAIEDAVVDAHGGGDDI